MTAPLALALPMILSAATSSKAPGPTTAATVVLDVRTSAEVSERVAQTFSKVLRSSLEAAGHLLLTTEALTEPAQVEVCGDNPACFSRILGGKGQVLVASLGRVGGGWIGSALLLDLATGAPAARAGASETEASKLARELARQLLEGAGPGAAVARLDMPASPRFVLLDVQGAGLPDGTVAHLGQVIAKELQRIERASVMSREEVEVMLGVERLRRVLDKSCDTSCFNRIAGALDADFVVTGRIGELDGTYVVQLNAIEQRGGLTAHRRSETFRGEAKELLDATRHVTQSLFGLDRGTGTLAVSASPEGARLSIDETAVGALPLPPRSGLSPGRHTVLLERDGFLPYRADVYVNPETTRVVWTELERAPERWYEKWWVWDRRWVGGGGSGHRSERRGDPAGPGDVEPLGRLRIDGDAAMTSAAWLGQPPLRPNS